MKRWKWFVPTFNGDLRLEPLKGDPSKTVLSIVDPTDSERATLTDLSAIFTERKWIGSPTDLNLVPERMSASESGSYRKASRPKWSVTIGAPLEEVGPVFVAAMKPGPAVLTAVRLSNGRVETVEHSKTGDTESKLKKLAKKARVKAAATVSRLTPCCPACVTGSVEPATEVLLSFLSRDEHATWSKDRYIVVRGGLSGHRYIVAHRHSEIAAKNGRICWDADDKNTMHFHGSDVPPEEEVLAAKLILEHREPWLRNEATCLWGEFPFTRVFKNPFGDINDGVLDAALVRGFGLYAAAMLPDASP